MNVYFATMWTAFACSLLFCRILIPVLRRFRAGQNILSYVKEHENKKGTPTMGGLAFITAAILSAVCFVTEKRRSFLIAIAIGLAYMIIGLLDDYLKRRHHENLGLRAWQKFAFQILVAIFAGIYCLRADITSVYLPFMKTSLYIGAWVIPFSIFVFVATVNAVNLTDGLDGLAAGTSLPFFVCLGWLIVLQNGKTEFSVLSFALAGALMGYLPFNLSPASVFMGDTGSLALGGFAASIAIFTQNALYILLMGVMFVFSVISVILQVIYYKATKGKRIFLMAPAHHHFQEKGFSETKIAYVYFLITLLLGTLCIVTQ